MLHEAHLTGIRVGRTRRCRHGGGTDTAPVIALAEQPLEHPLGALPGQHGSFVVLVILVDEPDAEQRYQQRQQQGHRVADEGVHVGTAEQ